MVSGECIANGWSYGHGTVNGKETDGRDGVTYHRNYHYYENTADCTIEADGVLYDDGNDDGYLRKENEVTKDNQDEK